MGDMSDSLGGRNPDQKRYSSEQFEAVLIAVRNGASCALTEMAHESITSGEENAAKEGDVRAVWHAAEIALALLSDRFVPKREALDDARELVERFDADA